MASLGFRTHFAVLFGEVLYYGMWGLGLVAPIASLGSAAILFFYYISGKWKVSKVVKKVNQSKYCRADIVW